MNEPALITAAQKGDLDSFNSLVLHYQTQVYNVAYRVIGEGDAAADATQEAFINAFKKIKSYKGGSFKAWLFRIVTNTCYDELRRRQRRPVSSLDALLVSDVNAADDEAQVQLATDKDSPTQAQERTELLEAIQNCLNTLSDDQRLAVVMRDVQGFDYKEVADTMKVGLGTLKSRLGRARNKMKDCLRQHHQELLPAKMRL